jgi:hypothetical protein
MKSTLTILAAIGAITILGSCTGSSQKNSPDTANNTYQAPKSADTSKATSATGDAPNLDNSGNGGTKIDTAKNK